MVCVTLQEYIVTCIVSAVVTGKKYLLPTWTTILNIRQAVHKHTRTAHTMVGG